MMKKCCNCYAHLLGHTSYIGITDLVPKSINKIVQVSVTENCKLTWNSYCTFIEVLTCKIKNIKTTVQDKI